MEYDSESRQIYLKTIRMLEKSISRVRNTDIAKTLGYSKPSVTKAIQKLVSDGFATNDKGICLSGLTRCEPPAHSPFWAASKKSELFVPIFPPQATICCHNHIANSPDKKPIVTVLQDEPEE